MLSWFEKRAPIRTKFATLLALHALLAGLLLVAIYLAIRHAGSVEGDVLLGGAVLAALGIALATLVAGRLICTPYVNTVVRMEALAAGDLSSPIAYTENLDCVGRMTKAMAIFRHSTEEANIASQQREMAGALGEGLGRLAHGDLCYRIETPFPADFEMLRSDYNRAMTAMMEAVSAVSHAASGVSVGANDIGRASDDLSRRTEQQAARLQETATAMNEITSAVRQTAEGANRANVLVGDTRIEAEQSGGVVHRAVEAMGDIERASTEISEIITVIDGIAFQTNLLALNAGVEAARAGDAGRGFAVVASEVRALAQRSAEAAKDIKTRILYSSRQVSTGVTLVNETGRALTRIIVRIGEMNALISSIAASAEQQATGLQQVNDAVAEMDGVTRQNAALVEQATAAARILAAEAVGLAREVACFKTDAGGLPATARMVPAHPVPDRPVRSGRLITPSIGGRDPAPFALHDDRRWA